jgi:hypothetical protein
MEAFPPLINGPDRDEAPDLGDSLEGGGLHVTQ